MARRRPFESYRVTTVEERRVERKQLRDMQKTKRYKKWLVWMHRMQHGECFYCKKAIFLYERKSYHIDHRVPIYWGGKSDYSNLCLACPSCNRYKSTHQLIRDKEYLVRMNSRKKTKVLYL